MFVLLKDVVIDDADVESLQSLSRVEGQSSSYGDVVRSGVRRAVLRPEVDLNGDVRISAFTAHRSGELSDILHHRVVARIEEDADHVGVVLAHTTVIHARRGCHDGGVVGGAVHRLFDEVRSAGQLPGGLDPVESAGFGAGVGQFFSGECFNGL